MDLAASLVAWWCIGSFFAMGAWCVAMALTRRRRRRLQLIELEAAHQNRARKYR